MDHCLILLISFVWSSYWKKRSKVDVKRAPKAPRNARHEGEGLKTFLFPITPVLESSKILEVSLKINY